MRPKEVDGKFPGKGSILPDGPEVEAGLGADGSKGWIIKSSRNG